MSWICHGSVIPFSKAAKSCPFQGYPYEMCLGLGEIQPEEDAFSGKLIFLLVFRQTLNTFFPYNEFRIVDEPLTISPLI